MSKLPIIGVPMGDPAGVGPEITVMSVNKPEIHKIARVVVAGDKGVLQKAMLAAKVNLEINVIESPAQGNYKEGVLNLIDMKNIDINELKMGQVQAMCGKAAFEYIKKVTELAMKKEIDAIATTPINKESFKAGEVPYIGHTEVLEDLTNTHNPLTMFQVHTLRVFFFSRHVSLRKACDLIKKDKMVEFIERCAEAMNVLGIKNAKMAVAGLNPHCGEHGLFGDEEVKEIEPAVKAAQAKGINVYGPIAADSVFHQGLTGRYDAVLSLYHDQGHIATKTLDFERTISLTNNMPFLRTSVDHGTAFDIAGTGKVSSVSMEEAIRLAALYAPSFNKK